MAKLGNGVKVNAKAGNMPAARMDKVNKIQGKVARVHKTIGNIVRATSHNYGTGGSKGHELGTHGHIKDEEK